MISDKTLGGHDCMRLDLIVYGLSAVFSVILLIFYLAGVPISIPNPFDIGGEQAKLIIKDVTQLIFAAGTAIPLILKSITELVKQLKDA